MISADFAPNEQLSDAFLSLKLLFQPWLWKKGNALKEVKGKIEARFPSHSAYFFLSGRSGLFTILKALQLPKGSEVIVQAFTCEAVILPILANGLKPVYVDIESTSFSMNPIDLQKKITDRTKVLILQHSFSMTPVYREKVISLVKEHNLLLIEDIAHGYSMKKIQNSTYLLSFGRSKALSSVFGGAVVTSNKELQKKLGEYEASLQMPSMIFILRLLLYKPISVFIKSTYDIFIGKLVHKITHLLHLIPLEITNKEKSGEYDPLLDKAYPNALAILLSHQLDKYERIQRNRASICSIYQKRLQKRLQVTGGLLRFPLLVKNPQTIIQKAAKKNIYLGSWYNQVVAPQSIDFTKMHYPKGSCPRGEELCKKIINLPTNISHQEALKVLSYIT